MQNSRQSTQAAFVLQLNKNLEMTRRISDKEEALINAELKQLSDVEEFIHKLRQEIEQVKWEQAKTINHPNMPFYALLAYQNNLLEKQEFSTLMLYWSGKKSIRSEIQTVHLYDSATKDQANEYLSKGLLQPVIDEAELKKYFNDQKIQEFKNQYSTPWHESMYLDKAQLEQFHLEMQKLPASEQRFFLVSNKEADRVVPTVDYIQSRYEENITTKKISIKDVIQYSIFRVFNTLLYDFDMIPSFGMMQTYLNVKFMKQAVEIIPVFGFSSLQDTRMNGLQSQRDMGLHFPKVFLPDIADNYNAPWHHFSFHDFYHAAIASLVPNLFRNVIVHNSDILYQLVNQKAEAMKPVLSFMPKKVLNLIKNYAEDEEDRAIRIIAATFIDMEHSSFGYLEASVHQKFWLAVATCIKRPSFFSEQHAKVYDTKAVTSLKNEGVVKIIRVIIDATLSQIPTLYPEFPAKVNISEFENPFEIINLIKEVWKQFYPVTFIESEMKKNGNPISKIVKEELVPIFTVKNITSIFQEACEHEIKELQQASMIYMAQQLLELVQEESFKDLQNKNPKRVKKFVEQMRQSRFFQDTFKSALIADSKEALELLLPSKTNIDQFDYYNHTALDYAVECKHVRVVKRLLMLGANPNPQQNSKALPTLFSAIYQGHVEILELLRRFGFNMNLEYNNQSWHEYAKTLMFDPKTFGGVIQKVQNVLNSGHGYTFFEHKEGELYARALTALRERSSQGPKMSLLTEDDLSKINPGKIDECAWEYLKSEIWACRR